MRGFGESTYNKSYDSLEVLSDDIAEFCDILGIKQAAVFGWSLGGGYGAIFAAKYPEKISKLILHCALAPKGFAMFESVDGKEDKSKRVTTREQIQNHMMTHFRN